jgi:hypothetical protein
MMIELINADQLAKATERAKASNLFVQPAIFLRQYKVTNRDNGNQYMSNFFVWNGKRYAHCNCKAGTRNILCKHLSSTAAYHCMRMAVQREAKRITLMPQAA